MRKAKNGSASRQESGISPVQIKKLHTAFDPATFLSEVGIGKTVVDLNEKEAVFSQGDQADAVFFIKNGKVKLTTVSQHGKESTVGRLGAGDFIGEECIAPNCRMRTVTAAALMECTVLRIDKREMLRVLHEEPAFSGLFVSFLLARSTQLEADLVD